MVFTKPLYQSDFGLIYLNNALEGDDQNGNEYDDQ
jgi:hypothetical protein